MKTNFRYINSAFLVILALLSLSLVSCKDEGTGADFIPSTTISVGTQYSNVFIAAFDTQFYDFVAAGSGSHTIYLTNLGSDMEWTLFTNPSYMNPGVIDSQDDYFDSTDETGPTVPLTAGTTYYLAIDEWDAVDSQYDLRITFP